MSQLLWSHANGIHELAIESAYDRAARLLCTGSDAPCRLRL